MMLSFLNSLVERVAKGPNQNGTTANGGSFKVPNILTAFLNDGQITELVAATGVMSDAKVLDGSAIPRHDWKYKASQFVTMRGTVAFERLSCVVPAAHSTTTKTYLRILLNDAVYPVPSCQDGPGKSCLLSTYASITSQKLAAAGNLRSRCNITATVAAANGNGTSGKGASFFGDLGSAWLGSVVP